MQIKPNSPKAWLLAARPKTLSAALIPVAVAAALAASAPRCNWMAIALCAMFAIVMQIAANFINDLFDYRKGTDRADRLGPERACAQGWISPRAMLWGIATTLLCAAAVGMSIFTTIPKLDADIIATLVLTGAGCMMFAFLYTTILSYAGMGDLLVVLFFGFVPCCGTYFAATESLVGEVWLAGLICGVLIDTLLVLNNYRDRDADHLSGKRTLIVICGERFGHYLYLLCGLGAWALTWGFVPHYGFWPPLFTLPYIYIHINAWRQILRCPKDAAMHQVRQFYARLLGRTSINMLIFGLLLALALLAGRFV